MQNNKDNKIIKVDTRPIEQPPSEIKPGGLKIGNVQTLNLFIEPIKKRYETHYKKDKIHLIVDLVLGAIVLFLIFLLVNLFLFSRARINLMDFRVSSMPENLINGQETEFAVNYSNTSKDTLKDVTLVFRIPDSLKNPRYSTDQFDSKTNTLKIGDLAEKASGQFTVKGLLIGNYTDKQEFIAAITYRNKYGQTSQEFFSEKFDLKDSVLKTEIKMPGKVVANGYFTADIILQNTSSFDLSKTKVKFGWPDNFSVRKTDMDKISDKTYSLGVIKANESVNHYLEGKLKSAAEQSLNMNAEVYAVYENKEYLIYQTQREVVAGLSNLKLGFLNTDANRNIAPGGKTKYTLFYKNNETYPLNNVELGLILTGDYADEKFLSNSYKGADGNQVIFNRNDYPQLAKLEPGQEGSITVEAAARTTISFGQYQEGGFRLQANVIASYDDPELNTRLTQESDPLFTIIDTDLNLKTTAMFFTATGDQIGIGNVPPIVGEYTSYWAIIKINNTNNKIKDLKVTAKVPAGIEFTDIFNVTDGEQIRFDEASRQLEWKIAAVPAFAGIFSASPEARIQLAITPTENQVGKSPLLLTDIKATATDEATNAFISASGANVSIAIFDDPSMNKVIE